MHTSPLEGQPKLKPGALLASQKENASIASARRNLEWSKGLKRAYTSDLGYFDVLTALLAV
jgi:hypothetical protein